MSYINYNIRKNTKLNLYILLTMIVIFLMSIFMGKYYNINLVNIILFALMSVFVAIYLFKHNKILITLTIFLSLILLYFTENLKFPNSIQFILDYLILIMMMKILFIKRKKNIISYIVLAFFFITISAMFANEYNVVNYLKTLYFDYFRYFIICIYIINVKFEKTFIIKIMKWLGIFLIIQIPIIIIQLINESKVYKGGYVIQDYASGLLGGKSTAELGGLLCITFILITVIYLYKKISNKVIILFMAAVVLIAILSEIKFVFLILPILVFVILTQKVNIKVIVICILSIFSIFLGINAISTINPDFENFLDKESIKSYINHSYGGSGLSRGNAMSIALDDIDNDIYTLLVGRGIGNSVASSYSSSNYAKNNPYYYRMFYWPYIVVEGGILGLLLIGSIYVIIMYYSIILMRSNSIFYNIVGRVGWPIIVLLVFMNYYSMAMLKINFSVIAWIIIGLISKYYLEMKEGNNEKNT